ncbi:thioesterase family protein [Acinetobacter pittii]|uniref:thioesterase family protein n=1 Tax=Acinetobacter pittii TaxID=48296 RepID=UPI001EE6154B|nr:thioesterase family protein [Acinetobacter pittii]MCG5226807.1 thioesterase family protein [Acinetobacter pittii]
MSAYYQLIDRVITDDVVTSYYRSTIHAQGAWNPNEQHMAPASGVISEELEHYFPRSDMRLARISFEILGLISFGEFSITTQCIRAGKTIELIEAVMQSNGKIFIIARAWRLVIQDTKIISGIEDKSIPLPESYENWSGLEHWGGGFIQTIQARADKTNRAGKGIVWLNTETKIVEGKDSSDFVHLMGMIDMANGIVPRQRRELGWAFPNLDLQIHLYRYPTGQWLGLNTVQQYGADGIGLTSSILHDIQGPFGRCEQILSLRAFN